MFVCCFIYFYFILFLLDCFCCSVVVFFFLEITSGNFTVIRLPGKQPRKDERRRFAPIIYDEWCLGEWRRAAFLSLAACMKRKTLNCATSRSCFEFKTWEKEARDIIGGQLHPLRHFVWRRSFSALKLFLQLLPHEGEFLSSSISFLLKRNIFVIGYANKSNHYVQTKEKIIIKSTKTKKRKTDQFLPRKSTAIKSRSPLTTKNYTVLGRVLHPNTKAEEEKYPRRPLHFLTSKIGETLFTSKHLLHSDGLMRPKVTRRWETSKRKNRKRNNSKKSHTLDIITQGDTHTFGRTGYFIHTALIWSKKGKRKTRKV